MRIIIFIFLTIISTNVCAQIESINPIFHDFPLHKERDSIYKFAINSKSIIILDNNYEIYRNDSIIPSFRAYLKQTNFIDSSYIQLTSGSIKNEVDNVWKSILIFSIHYELKNKKHSKEHFNQIVKEIETISINKQLIGYDHLNEKKRTMNKWSFNEELGVQLYIEIKKTNKNKYLVKLEYSRYEN